MVNPYLEVAVNYEFTQMLKALEAKEFFGKDEKTCRDAFAAIAVELGNRQFACGLSSGAAYEAGKLTPIIERTTQELVDRAANERKA